MKQVISPPFIICPRCGGKTFGISKIFPDYYLRKCSKCSYPDERRNEAKIYYILPHLSKKIVYIDQFALSYMVRALHPAMRATGNSKADNFWIHLYQKLDRLIKMQIIICPQSNFHLQESVVSSFFEHLEKMYHLLSRGSKFADQYQIRKAQIENSVRSWILGSTKKDIVDSTQSVFNWDVNTWLPREIVFSPSQYSQAFEKELRESRERIHQQWIQEFYIWKKYANAKFEQWIEDFYSSLKKEILRVYPDYLKHLINLPANNIHDIKLCKFLLESIDFLNLIHIEFNKEGITHNDFWLKVWEYLQSESFQQIPFIKLSALFYASFARKAGSGQKKPPDQGITNDLNVLSLLLPYCDAMFIDNQCRGCLEEKDVRENIDFSTQVFSPSNKEDFLEYLEQLEKNFPPRYQKKVEELYGLEWINSTTKLY
jgi:ribosomal protein L37E